MRTSPFRRRAAAWLLALAVGLSACGDDTADPGDAASPGGDATEPGDTEPADGNAVTIANFAFEGPSEVAVGTTVTATNRDSAAHTWSAVDGAWDSQTLGEGDSFSHTFDEAGTFDYECKIHPSMTGSITVAG